MNPVCNFHSSDGKDGLYRSTNKSDLLDQCCPSCIHKFYESNLPIENLSGELKNSELNKDNKQDWAENGNNIIRGFISKSSDVHPVKRAGFDSALNIPVGYNSRPPYYYPVWEMDPEAAGTYKPFGTKNKGEELNTKGFLLEESDGGKGKCSNGQEQPGDQVCDDNDNKVIHNNLFHCKRGSWKPDSYGTTPPRGAGTTDEDKELDTYNLYDYDWANNKWIKKDQIYGQEGYYGTRNCTGRSTWKRDGGAEADHVVKHCNKSRYWKNAVRRQCVGTAHILSAKMNIMVYVDDREFTYTYVPVVYNYLLVV